MASNTAEFVKLPFCGATWISVMECLEQLAMPLESTDQMRSKLINLWAAFKGEPAEEVNIKDTPYKGFITFIDGHIIESEKKAILNEVLPFIARAAMSCEDLSPKDGLPIIIQGGTTSTSCRQITLSRKFICSLLACAFLSLFPPNKEIGHLMMPFLNFSEWFSYTRNLSSQREKTKCILNYFKRISPMWDKEMELKSSVIFSRIYLPQKDRLTWEELLKSEDKLCEISVTEDERIEDAGPGTLQVDFANQYIGGGVLGAGRVQEEIRFCLCPELMAAMAFQESMTDHEAILIEGFEQFSDYSGYANSLKFKSDFNDPAVEQYSQKIHQRSPRQKLKKDSDDVKVMNTALVAIDAIPFAFSGKAQYNDSAILREINKAYCGFSQPTCEGSSIPDKYIIKTSACMRPLVTGNWGCGAFGGNPQLKAMIQWIAASARNTPRVKYCTFGEERMKDLERICTEVRDQEWGVKNMAKLLHQYCLKLDDETWERKSLFQFIRDNINVAL